MGNKGCFNCRHRGPDGGPAISSRGFKVNYKGRCQGCVRVSNHEEESPASILVSNMLKREEATREMLSAMRFALHPCVIPRAAIEGGCRFLETSTGECQYLGGKASCRLAYDEPATPLEKFVDSLTPQEKRVLLEKILAGMEVDVKKHFEPGYYSHSLSGYRSEE